MSVYRETYKGIDGWVLESDHVKAVFVEYGAKMVSLVCKETGKELLWQNRQTESYRIPKYLDDYESGEFSGFDEMFPQIVKCWYDEYPFEGTLLPDHGEVWSLKWDAAVQDDAVIFSVQGVKLPYRLTKKVFFSEDGTLAAQYTAENLSGFDIRYVWAAHPLFVLEDDMKVLWDAAGSPLLVTASKTGKSGKVGDVIVNAADFVAQGLAAMEDHDYLKYYIVGNNAPDTCALEYPDETSLKIKYVSEKNTCLGFWINKGGMRAQYNIAPEFCSATMDDMVTANKLGSHCVLAAKGKDQWSLEISLCKKTGDK